MWPQRLRGRGMSGSSLRPFALRRIAAIPRRRTVHQSLRQRDRLPGGSSISRLKPVCVGAVTVECQAVRVFDVHGIDLVGRPLRCLQHWSPSGLFCARTPQSLSAGDKEDCIGPVRRESTHEIGRWWPADKRLPRTTLIRGDRNVACRGVSASASAADACRCSIDQRTDRLASGGSSDRSVGNYRPVIGRGAEGDEHAVILRRIQRADTSRQGSANAAPGQACCRSGMEDGALCQILRTRDCTNRARVDKGPDVVARRRQSHNRPGDGEVRLGPVRCTVVGLPCDASLKEPSARSVRKMNAEKAP